MELITTEEFLQQHSKISHFYDDTTGRMVCFADDVKAAMNEYGTVKAEFYVQKALQAAAANAKVNFNYAREYNINRESILNAYPLTNIK